MELKHQLRQQWESLSNFWINRVSADQETHRTGLLDDWMLEAVGDVSGLRVIDIGCGEGRFCRMLAQRGAKATGVDLCQPFIEHARAHRFDDEEYMIGDMERLDKLADASFDLAVSYITLVDVFDFEAVIKEAYRVLCPGGRFIVCNLQPMVTAGNGWIKHWNTRLFFKLDDYFDESVRVIPIGGHTLSNFHRTLSSYINAFLNAGFVLEGLQEPKPSPEQVARFPDVEDNLRVPDFIIYLLRKPQA